MPIADAGSYYNGTDVEAALQEIAAGTTQIGYSVTTHTASGSITTSTINLADCTAADVTLTLPAVSGLTGRFYVVKRTDASANDVIIDGAGAETIDDQATLTLSSQYDAVQLVCDGTEWWIL